MGRIITILRFVFLAIMLLCGAIYFLTDRPQIAYWGCLLFGAGFAMCMIASLIIK